MSAVDDVIKNAQFSDGAAWSDISGKPSEFPPETHTHNLAALSTTGATTGEVIKFNGTDLIYDPVAWSEITSKPTEFTPSSHNHAVSDLTQSGATTGQLLQWNGTAWVPATVASGGKEIITKIKTARQTVTSSTTNVNDNHLSALLSANKTYQVELELFVSAPSSGGFKFSIESNNSLADANINHTGGVGTSGMNLGGSMVGSSSSVITITSPNNSIKFAGYITTTGTAPTITLKWAQATSNGTGTYIEVNSFMKFTEV